MMFSKTFNALTALTLGATTANAYFLMNVGTILQERSDPIVNPKSQSAHVHKIAGGSSFALEPSTSNLLNSECTSTKIKEDKSNYWIPQLYFQWDNGSFTDVKGDFVIYYLYSDKEGETTPFPEDFRMLSGSPELRTYNKDDYAQQAITFLCLDFDGETTHHDSIPQKVCPSGIRSQVNFPSCWDGVNADSDDHKSHVAFPSGGPDSGSCKDPKFPKTLPRIFIEHYWATGDFTKVAGEAKNPTQPFVFSNGDPTGYGYHADFINGWEPETLQKVVDQCNCNPYGDPQCCADKGIFTLQSNDDMDCKVTGFWDEKVKGTLDALPGNNPVVAEGGEGTMDLGCKPPQFGESIVYRKSRPENNAEIVDQGTCDGSDSPSSDTPASSSASSEPSSTKGAEPSSTKDAEPSSTKESEPSTTEDAASSSNPEPTASESISVTGSPTKVLISDPTSSASPGNDEDDSEDCEGGDEEDEPTTKESSPEPTSTKGEGSTSAQGAPSSSAQPQPTSPSGDDDDKEYCDDDEYDDEDSEDNDTDAPQPSTTSESVPEPSSSDTTGPASSDSEAPSSEASDSAPAPSSSADPVLIDTGAGKAVDNNNGTSDETEGCKAGGRRYSYYNVDGSPKDSEKRSSVHKRGHHHMNMRRGQHLSRFDLNSNF